MKIVDSIPSSRAASATPCAWLPAEAATTPRARSSGVSLDMRLKAPRILYEPVRCSDSSLRYTGEPRCSASTRDDSMGVTLTTLVTTSRAALIASRLGPKRDQFSGVRSVTSEHVIDVGVRMLAPGAPAYVADDDVRRCHDGYREECARNACNVASGGDREHNREGVHLDRLPHDERLKHVALELLHGD